MIIYFLHRQAFNFLIEDEKITHFHVPHSLSLITGWLAGDYSAFPVLKRQIDHFLQMLEIKLILEARLEEDDKRYFKEILSEPGSMNDKLQMLPELKSTQVTAEGDDLEDVIYVPEHAYGVFKADNDVVVKAGTTDIYSCIGVVLVNRKDSSFGVTHLDHSTIKQYESSLHDMFELLNARNDTVDVYIQANLTGGDHPTVIK